MACTISGTIKTTDGALFDGTVLFVPTPQSARVTDDSVVSAASVEVEVMAGVLSTDLEAGYYWVRLPDTKQFQINVPDESSANLEDIVVAGSTGVEPLEHGLPEGGEAGEAMVKASGDDFDAEWADTERIRIYAGAPTAETRAGAELLHINTLTGAAHYWDGSDWVTLIEGTP